jgi:hypothetical protein
MGKSSDDMNLNQMSTKFPFKIPEGYFDDFPMKIMDKVNTDVKITRESFFIRYLKPVGLVASLVFVLGLIYFSAKVFPLGKSRSDQSISKAFDEEFLISYPLSDQIIFETLENGSSDKPFNNDQLESVLLASVTEYDLIDLNN